MVKGVKNGVDLINDVSGFKYDSQSLDNLRKFKISKVVHHMKGTPSSMQKNPKYQNVLQIFMIFLKIPLSIKKLE